MPAQVWSPERYQQNAAFVPAYGEELIAWLDPKPGEHILDLGCGDGTLTVRLRESGAHVVGVDSSETMAEAARARGLRVVVMNGEALSFTGEFDAVFSNAAMHWMLDADRVAAGVRRALRLGGRFVGEFGGHGCVGAIQTAIRAVLSRRAIAVKTPWYFPTAAEYQAVLERHGFTVSRMLLFPRPTPLPTGIRGWLETFAGKMLGAVEENERARVLDEIEDLLAPALRDASGQWTADYVRLRFSAVRAT